MIKVEKISKSFGFVKAVEDLSFEIKKGEIVGFLGPNGAGKTTTMRMLTGFTSADSGKITVDGKDIEENTMEIQKKIGYLPESNPLYKDMLVMEFLRLTADLNGIKKEKRKEALDFVVNAVNIKDVFYRPIGELSKGFKQRVGIAAALIHNPEIIIMDEPTEGLDPNQRKEIRALIKKLAKDHTIIISTHIMQEASAICDRMLIINKGKLVANGTTEELSLSAKNERSLTLEIEGKGIRKELEKISAIKDFKDIHIEDKITKLSITTEKATRIQPEISKIANKNNWIIWKLVEKEQNLEDIFQDLTKIL
ncbi:ATP-binding cassette domain-containing protein [bacterium]|jgi:ABC-2 type transport system ATP-binding protein|nr:ATP-binding cassette domain-containing protein [bacterium]MBT4250776.1 ATP-binding cassette domain-containing protein [bacterium]MBT4598220.1 ATP-binding cassette domain-containing protein [bacterium]MBT6753818.1 ATP-binding cassette domain-containing protein [bacterium]MBT7037469.1 ATP-binding cassette domain-containing protein [bacterium]